VKDRKHILVATDLVADDDNPVIEKAKELADNMDAEVSIVHVIELVPGWGVESGMAFAQWQEEVTPAVERRLAAAASRLGVPAERQFQLMGSAKESIVEQAKLVHADLIVMGSHCRRGADAWLLGSTAKGVLHRAPCDVLIVRVGSSEESE